MDGEDKMFVTTADCRRVALDASTDGTRKETEETMKII